jgi:ankyrin repeat protein/beta-lactamase regulating signal transducer with metallopeptidase domain
MNVLVNLFSETWARRLGWVLIHFLWEGTVIALVLAILLRLLTNASSHTRYILAGIALLICAIAPAITWTMSAPHEAGSSPMTELGPVNLSQSQDRISSPSIALPTSLEVSIETETPWQVRLIQAANASLPYAVGLWFVGLFILSTRLTLGWIWMKRLCRSSIPTKDPRCLEKFQSLLTRMQITRPVRLLESALIEVPTLIGWLRPTILIPVALFAGMTPDQLEAIFAHELAHVRRYDYLTNLLQTILETVLFYHPAIWWISRMLREERENCCDDLALEIMHDRIAYVSALAQLEEGRAMPLALSASGGSLLQRIRRIAGVNDRKVSIWPIWILIFAVLSVICLTKGRASEKVSSQTQSTDDKRDDQLFNDLRIENLKVKDMPLDQFVQKISKELAAQDPQKLGISFVLNVPPGEPPIPVSLDFTKIRGYRANVAMILNPLKARYPIRYKLNVIPGTVYIWQIPKDEVAFDKKASSTLIDINFNQADPVTALKFVQSSSANKRFAFDLDVKSISELDALKKLPPIDLKARQVSVDQALRSIFYLADLHPLPLRHFTGYTIQPQSPDATKALTYLEAGTQAESFKLGTGAENQIRENLQEVSHWSGPSMNGQAYGSNGAQMGPITMTQKVPPPNGDLEQNFTVDPKIIDKVHIQVATSLEITDSQGKSLGKVSGHATLFSGERAMLTSSGSAAISLPGKGSGPGLGFVGVMQITLANEDGQPLLPPPSPGMEDIRVSMTSTSAPLTTPSNPSKPDAPSSTVANPALAKGLVAAAKQGDIDETTRLLKQGANPNANQDPDGRNALFAAAVGSQIETVKLLLQHGADPNCKNGCGNEPIDWVLDQGHLDMATVLHDAGARISPEAWAGVTGDLPALKSLVGAGVIKKETTDGAMKFAVSMGHLDVVKFLESLNGKPIAGKFLVQAAKSGNIPMMQYVLTQGADIKKDGGDAMDQAVIFYDQVEAVKFLLAHGVDPNRFSRWNEDILSEAQSAAMVKVLLDAGANPNTQGDYETPLTHAPDAESVRLLVQHGANLKPKLKDGFTLIRSVIIRGGLRDKPDVIDELIKQGAEFDPKGNGISALLGAAQFNEIDTMKVLMDHGVSPNAYSDEPLSKSSALHNATWNPNPEAVKLLLERGANPSGDPRDVNSPLSMALMFGQWESADLLRKAGAHDVGDLSMAAARGDAAKVEDILKNGANVNETDNGGDTPLYYAVRRGHVEISQLLLEHGANVNLFNTSGMTPKSMFDFTATTMNPMRSEMDWGVPQEEGQRRIIAFKELFVKYLADPNYRDSQGRTALHQMAFSGNTMVDFLTGDKAHSADPNIQDCDGNTPLLLAALSSHATETVTSISTYENGKTPQ